MPRILLQQGTNLVNKFALLLHKCRFAQDSRDKPENDGSWRCWLSICCKLFNYPSPADKSATDKPSKEGLLYFSICLTRGRYNKRGADNTTSIDKPNACIRCRCVGRPLGQTIKFVLLALFAWCSTLYAGAKRTAHYCFYCLLRGIKVLPLVATGGEVLNNITFKGLDVVRQYAALLERQKTHTTETAESGVDKVVSSCEKNPSVLKTYTNFLRQRKTALDAPLYAVSYGRSMIEMLGVLAIIGVLSVGGIAGYSKAMTKWKINKSIEQIEQITHNTFTAFANQKKMADLYSYKEDDMNLLKSLGIISEDMIVDGKLKNPFGGTLDVVISSFPIMVEDHTSFRANEKYIEFQTNKLPHETCMALGSLDWAKSFYDIVSLSIAPNSDNVDLFTFDCMDLSGVVEDSDWLFVCNNAKKDDIYIPLPIPPNIVAEHCNCKDNDCYFGVAFTIR